jgi:predicted metal-binding membrane protein
VPRAERIERVARALRWRPEWRIAVVVALSWIALSAGAGGHRDEAAAQSRQVPGTGTHSHLHHHHHGRQVAAAAPPQGSSSVSTAPLEALPGWTLMAIAMMVPITFPAVRHVGLNSIRTRRQRAMFLYSAVYVSIWIAFGVVALTAAHLFGEAFGLGGPALLPLALATTAAWQLTRTKRRALFRCRRTVPLPPIGLRADAGCARFALQQGARCVISCWPLMLVMTVVGHAGLLWMAALTALAVAEELTLMGRRLLRPSAAAFALAAALVALGV